MLQKTLNVLVLRATVERAGGELIFHIDIIRLSECLIKCWLVSGAAGA